MTAAPPDVDLGWRMGAPARSDDPATWSHELVKARFSNMRGCIPTAAVWCGAGPVSVLPQALRDDIDALTFRPLGGDSPMRWDNAARALSTDGLLVLHRGRIVYERYGAPLQAHIPHVAMSVTKSLVGTLAAAEMVAGRLDPAAPVTQYLLELAGSAWATATVRQTMDMTTSLAYDEDYTRPDAHVWDYLRAGGMLAGGTADPAAPGLHAYLQTVQASGAHGQRFAYKTVNTEVLGWLLERVTGQPLAALVQDRLWGPMGAEYDAYFGVDGHGTAGAGGAFSGCLRDMARFGELMRCDGFYNGRQIVPAEAVADIRRGGDPAHFAQAGYATLPGWSYRHMWWVTHNAHGAYCARGIHGQAIYVDPAAEMVIARFASFARAANAFLDPLTLPAFHALARHLIAHP